MFGRLAMGFANVRVVLEYSCWFWCRPKNESADHVAGAGWQSSPPSLLGHCNATCAFAHWTSVYGAPDSGITKPICGVPGCEAPT